jgi:translation initiation factor 4E
MSENYYDFTEKEKNEENENFNFNNDDKNKNNKIKDDEENEDYNFIKKLLFYTSNKNKEIEDDEKKDSSNQNIQLENNEIPINNYPLNSTWNFWFASRKEKVHSIPYGERLIKIATFDTMENFLLYYSYIKSVDLIERNTDIGLFKEGYQPLWESCPEGACWFLRFKKTDNPIDINYKWEKLVFALVGETIDEPNILGAILSIRGRETIIELWFNYFKYDKIKNTLAQKFRSVLQIDKYYNIYFKDNEKSLMDKSTIRNAETYSFKKQRKSTFN